MEMELGLRLGHNNGSPFGFPQTQKKNTVSPTGLHFSLLHTNDVVADSSDPPSPPPPPPLQLDLLLPHAPLPSRSSSQTDHVSEAAAVFTAAAEGGGEWARNPLISSSLELELCKNGGGAAAAGRFCEPENKNKNMSGDELMEDDDENVCSRKKLRLSRQQSAFLEESFKEHHTLYPKQKLELARRLNLRPRQVEVWFQNRRARTKLKQTEVDCEYLKKCCETLTQHNTKLLKELSDLRALKTTDSLFFQLPPTTLTICPSCERAAAATTGKHQMSKPSAGFSFSIFTNSSDQTE